MDFGPFGTLNKVAESTIKKWLPEYNLNIPSTVVDEVVRNFRKELKKQEFEHLKQLQRKIAGVDEGSDDHNALLDQQQTVIKVVITRINKQYPDYDWDTWLE